MTSAHCAAADGSWAARRPRLKRPRPIAHAWGNASASVKEHEVDLVESSLRCLGDARGSALLFCMPMSSVSAQASWLKTWGRGRPIVP